MFQIFINNASNCYNNSKHFQTNSKYKPSRPRPPASRLPAIPDSLRMMTFLNTPQP